MKKRVIDLASGFETKHAVICSVALAMALLALNYGGYGTDTVSALAFISWGLILVGLGFGFLPRARLSTSAWVALGLMVAIATWAALAISWSDDAGLAYIRAIQIATATGIFAVVILFSKPGEGSAWIWGLTLGFASIVFLAALSRFVPGFGDDAELTNQLGSIIGGRLSWPIGYWNGLGVATACLLVLCVWHGGHAARPKLRRAAAAAVPFAAVVMYLCSSRGSLVALVCGLAIVIGLGPSRRALTGTMLIGIAGSIPLVLIASGLHEVVHAGTGSKAVIEGFILLAATLTLSAASWWLRDPLVRRLEAADLNHKTTVRVSIVVGVIVLIFVVASDPAQRISAFTTVPVEGIQSKDSTFATEHLLSESGNGRWQLWESAINAFQAEPVKGIGSGGFEAWFKIDGSFWMKTIDPHSLPLEFLAELGLVGFLLLAGMLGFTVYAGINRYRAIGREINTDDAGEGQRPELALFLALLAVGTFGFSIDWTGQIPVLFGAVMIFLAALTGPLYASMVPAELKAKPGPDYLRYAVVGAVMLCCGAVMIASARQYEASRSITSSRSAFADGDGQLALERAERAVSATPWAGAAYAQLAAVQEKVDGGGAAVATVMEATRRSPKNDSYWLLQSDIQKRLGLNDAALISALVAQGLNPNSLYWVPKGN